MDLRIERIQLALRYTIAERSLRNTKGETSAHVFSMALEGLDMARQLDYSVGVARVFFWLGILHYLNWKAIDALTAFNQADNEVTLPDEEKLRVRKWKRWAKKAKKTGKWPGGSSVAKVKQRKTRSKKRPEIQYVAEETAG